MLFVSFTKGPGGFFYVFIITGEVPTLIPIDGITWETMGSLSLGETRRFLMVLPSFEVSLDTIPTTDLFNAFTKTLPVRYDYVTLTLNLSGGSRGTVSTLVVNPINGLTGRPVEPFLHFVQSPHGVLALGESLPEVFFFLFEQLRIATHSLSPMGEGVDNTKLGREVMVAIPL